jgi:GAF domain-containing protein
MLKTKKIVHVADVAAEETYTEQRHPTIVAAVELGGVRTILFVPLLKGDELIGAFSLQRQEVRPFTDEQIDLLKNFAAQAVIAIENARLLNELRQRTVDLSQRTAELTESLEQQTATSEVLQVISSSPADLQPIFATMLEKAARLCEANFGDIFRCENDALQLVAALNKRHGGELDRINSKKSGLSSYWAGIYSKLEGAREKACHDYTSLPSRLSPSCWAECALYWPARPYLHARSIMVSRRSTSFSC